MKPNIGKVDRLLRVIVGIVAVTWGVTSNNWWGALGIIPLITAAIGWCPPYAIFGVETCPSNTKENETN